MTDMNPLCQYVQENDISSMAKFLEKNPNSPLVNEDCNIKNLIPFGNGISADVIFGNNVPLLMFAVLKDSQQIVHLTVEKSNVLEIDSTGQYGDTSLIASSLLGDFNSVKLLVDHGASVNKGDEHDNTPLHKVALGTHFTTLTGRIQSDYIQNYLKIAKYLLDNKADINAVAHGEGQPDGAPINVAMHYNFSDMVELFVKRDADLTIKDDYEGRIPLCEIPLRFNEDKAKELLEYAEQNVCAEACSADDIASYDQACKNYVVRECTAMEKMSKIGGIAKEIVEASLKIALFVGAITFPSALCCCGTGYGKAMLPAGLVGLAGVAFGAGYGRYQEIEDTFFDCNVVES